MVPLKKFACLLPIAFLGCQDITAPKSRSAATHAVLAPRVMTAAGGDPVQVDKVHVRLTLGASDSVVLDTTYAWALKAVALEVPVGKSFKLTLQGRNDDDPNGTWRWSGTRTGTVDSTDETVWADTVFIGQLAAPTLSAVSGSYQGSLEVNATAPAGASLRYTLDGTDPVAASPAWSAGRVVSSSAWLRVRAFLTQADGSVLVSQAAEANYAIVSTAVPQGPQVSPEGGVFQAAVPFTVTAPAGAVAEISRDGYSFAPVVGGLDTARYSQTVLVRSRSLDGLVTSPARAVSFTVDQPAVTPAVTFSEVGGTVRTSRLVSLRSAADSAAIQYSFDNRTWTDYKAAVRVTGSRSLVTLWARAHANGRALSPATSVSFYFDP